MARPIWKGHVSFGLVNIPVSLFPGEKHDDLHFRLLDSRDRARIRYERVNEVTGQEVPWDEVVKAYEFEDGNYVVLEEEDFKRAAVEATQTVEIEDFVDQDALEYVYFERPYYLVPGKKGEKGYVLLREALKRTRKIGIARVVLRERQYLSAVLPQGRALVLALLRYRHELRDPAEFELPGEDLQMYKVAEKEIDLAEKLIEAMSAGWEPEKYHDDYREALLAWIEKKAREGETAVAPLPEPAAEAGGEVIDMMELLRRSVEGKERAEG